MQSTEQTTANDLKDYILVLDDFLDSKTCDDLVTWFDNNEQLHQNGPVTTGYNESIKKCMEATIPSELYGQTLTNTAMGAYEIWLKKGLGGHREDLYLTGYSISKYSKGDGWFEEHVDRSPGIFAHRIFGVLIYLNDVDEGGGTEFTRQRVTVSAKKGRVVIFPAEFMFPHRGQIPISGDKYLIPMFINFNPYSYQVQ